MSLQNEISLLVSSDATQGATNKTLDGAYFEISLGTDGLKIPNTLTILRYQWKNLRFGGLSPI